MKEEVSWEQLEKLKISAQNPKYFDDVIKKLYNLEKFHRNNNDSISSGRILVTICRSFYEKSLFSELNENIVILANKKHLQSKLAIGELIKECSSYVDHIEDLKVKTNLIETLRNVSEGKLYAENERAKLSMKLSKIRKEEGNLTAAIKILEQLKIDTLGTVSKKDRIELILEQMELLMETKDFIKCLILAKKISVKSFEGDDKELEVLKIRYYRLMIAVESSSNYLNTSRHYQAILETKHMQSLEFERKEALAHAIIYCILAPFDHEQCDMMQRLKKHKLIGEVDKFGDLLKEFIKNELIDWYYLKDKFKDSLMLLFIFDHKSETGLQCWKDLRTRIIEHNIKIFSNYYSRAYLTHMSDLLYISVSEIEKHLSNLIVNRTISAKIDRLTGIVNFTSKPINLVRENGHKAPTVCQQQNDKLNSWLFNVSTFMKLIDNTTHLINKELCNNIAQQSQVQGV